MDEMNARRLVALNTEFYRQAAGSFSATRHGSWPGWEIVADCLEHDLPGRCLDAPSSTACAHALDASQISVLDLACGNMRFEAFLEERMPDHRFTFDAVDNCMQFDCMQTRTPVAFHELDLVESLMADTLEQDLGISPCMAVACFAFLHHIPSTELRERFMRSLVSLAAPGGLVFVSLWSFADEPDFAANALATTQKAIDELGLDLDPSDYLLGWQNNPGLYRYCHSFDEDEADDLAECVEPHARLIRRYRADGRSGKMNTYLVFQRA